MAPPSWRLVLAVREAAHNAFARSARAFILVAVAVLAGSAGPAVLAAESGQLRRQLAELEARGSAVLHFGGSNPRSSVLVERPSCEDLARRPEVARAGILVQEGDRAIPEFGPSVPVFSASPSLFPGLRNVDVLVGRKLDPSQRPRHVQLGNGTPRVGEVAELQPEGIPTNGALVVPLSSAVVTADACIVVLAPFQDAAAIGPVLASQLDVTGGQVAAVRTLRQTSDPLSQWAERPGQYVVLLCAAIGGLASALFAFARSGEFAAYRMSGTGRASLALILTAEELMRAGMFAAAGAAAAVIVAPHVLSSSEVALWLAAGAALWFLVAAIGIVRGVAIGVVALTRDR